MNSTSRNMGSKKPLFSVFSDENADSSNIKPLASQHKASSSTSGSTSSLPVPSKRIKMGAPLSSKPVATSTGLYSASSTLNKSNLPTSSYSNPRTALSTKSITVLADKENIDPTGKRKTNNEKGKDRAKDSRSVEAKPDLWKGKQPFEFASPEKTSIGKTSSRTTISTKYIYDLPGVEASKHVTSSSASQHSCRPTLSRPIGSNMAISKPNKKNKPMPLKRSGAFEIFKDDTAKQDIFAVPRTMASSSSRPVNRPVDILTQTQNLGSPVSSVQASDRRAKELTESPLADVTLAYTGHGRFSNSPTADSGFGSRETSVSPLPSARSFTSSTNKLSSSLLRAHQNDHLSPPSTANIQTSIDDEELPNALSSLSISSLSRETNSNKRRISQVSNLSCTARASTSSLIAEGESLNLRHVNEVESPDLEAFASEQLDAHRYERNEPGTEDERDEEESVSPIVPLVKSVSNTASSTFPVQPRGIQSTFGQRTSIPTRQPLSMRI